MERSVSSRNNISRYSISTVITISLGLTSISSFEGSNLSVTTSIEMDCFHEHQIVALLLGLTSMSSFKGFNSGIATSLLIDCFHKHQVAILLLGLTSFRGSSLGVTTSMLIDCFNEHRSMSLSSDSPLFHLDSMLELRRLENQIVQLDTSLRDAGGQL